MKILPFIGPAVLGLFVSFVVTMLAWNIQIEHRAFKCTDDVGFGFFWESMNTHQGAGDTPLPGWTWGKIKTVHALYEAGFILLWFGITAATARALRERPNSQPS